jgi:hypothetical protein
MSMKEPPMGSVVIDVRGNAWQRNPVGWTSACGDGSWRYTWKQLLKEMNQEMDYPTQEWAPVLGDPRLPMIVYVPHEELVFDDADL